MSSFGRTQVNTFQDLCRNFKKITKFHNLRNFLKIQRKSLYITHHFFVVLLSFRSLINSLNPDTNRTPFLSLVFTTSFHVPHEEVIHIYKIKNWTHHQCTHKYMNAQNIRKDIHIVYSDFHSCITNTESGSLTFLFGNFLFLVGHFILLSFLSPQSLRFSFFFTYHFDTVYDHYPFHLFESVLYISRNKRETT